MYYSFDFSTEKKDVGSEFPQIQKMKSGYNSDGPHSVYKLGRCYEALPNFTPDLDGFILHSRAKKTDFISKSLTSRGFIISEKVKRILSQYKLPLHAFYPIKLYHKKQKV